VAVVLACMVTAYFIANSPNQIVSDQDIEIEHIKDSKTINNGDAPAMLARNHAAMAVIPAPKAAREQAK